MNLSLRYEIMDLGPNTGFPLHKAQVLPVHAQYVAIAMHLVLKSAPEPDNKGILCKSEDISLVEDLLYLLFHGCPMLAHLLHGKAVASLFVPHQVHGPVQHTGT